MKGIWIFAMIICFYITGLAQEGGGADAAGVLNQAKQAALKNTTSLERLYVESASRYNVRKARLAAGIVPAYDYRTKLWLQSPEQIKLKKLTTYPGGSLQLTEDTVFEKAVQDSIKLKNPSDNGFSPFFMQEPGDAKKNEEILLNKVKYEAFCLGFPIFFSFSEKLDFEYLGVAKSGDQNADVLGTSVADIYTIKLYIDRQTHQLLLLSAKFTDPKTAEEIEHKYFFSDYREENGINFAHKVVIRENGEVIEERDIKTVELNPKLENNFFALKK